MKDYLKPEVKLVRFETEAIADILDGDLGIGSANETLPWEEED